MSEQFETREGTASNLMEGDFVESAGGVTSDGKIFKRYTVNSSVISTSVAPRARTRMKINFARIGSFTLRMDYPVKYRRPLA